MLDGRENYTTAQLRVSSGRQSALNSFTQSSAKDESDSEDSDNENSKPESLKILDQKLNDKNKEMMQQSCLSKSSKDLACMALAQTVQELENEIKLKSNTKAPAPKTASTSSLSQSSKYKQTFFTQRQALKKQDKKYSESNAITKAMRAAKRYLKVHKEI